MFNKKENIICVIAVLLAILIGLTNPHGNLISIFENFWYLIIMFIFFVNIKAGRFILNKFSNDSLKEMVKMNLSLFYKKSVKILIIGVMVFLKLLFGGIIIYNTLNKVQMPILFFKNTFFINNSVIISFISIITEIIVVILFSKKLINLGKGDEYICL